MKHILLTALLCITGLAAANDHVFPLDLTKHMPSEKPAQVKKVDAHVVEWNLPDGRGQSVTLDLAKLGCDPKQYDEIRFDLKPMLGPVRQKMQLFGHLDVGEYSRWYQKARTPVDQWTTFRYDLHLDDDGVYARKKKKKNQPPPKDVKHLIVSLSMRYQGLPGEGKARKAQFRNLRLVKRMVAADFKLMETEVFDDGGEVGCIYQLHLENRTKQEQTAKIELDSAKTLKWFKVSGPTEVTLNAGEKKSVPVKIYIDRTKAMALPTLYAEPLYPKVYLDGIADSDVIPLRGYRRFAMWGCIPVFNHTPWTPATFQAFLDARQKAMPGVKAWREGVVRRADNALKYDWPVPDFGPPLSSWGYMCKCKNWLQHDPPNNPRRHKCRKCGKIVEGDLRIDREGLERYNGARGRNVRDLALAWLISGDKKYAEKATKMLLKYAEKYPDMPFMGMRSTAGAARLGYATLKESYILPRFAEGYHYLEASSVLDEEKRAKVVHFLRQVGAIISRHSVEYNNQQAEHIRAYGTAGLSTGFWPLAALALYGECGWHEVVENGYTQDGMAPEGSAYHRSVFKAMNEFGTFVWGYGVNLYTPRFKRVFDGSLNAGLAVTSYELAYRVYGDPTYIPVILKQRGRIGETSALFGRLGLPDISKMKAESVLMPGGGFVYLKRGNVADYNEIRLNYINQFDRHEHDRLTTFFYRNGRQVDSTVGRIAYGVKGSNWMLATAAHNCIVIDGKSVNAVGGRLITFDGSPDTPIAVVASDPQTPFYDGVDQLRAIALIENLYIVFDRVVCDKPRTIDRYQWGKGRARLTGKMQSVDNLKDLPQAGKLTGIKGGPAGRSIAIDYEVRRKKKVENAMRMRLVADQEVTPYTAVTFGGWKAKPMEVSFVRAPEAKAATMLAAFALGPKTTMPDLQITKVSEDELAFVVKTKTATYTVTIQPKAKKVTVNK